MKRLQSCPPSLPIPPPDKMLNNVSWLRNHPDLIEYIKVIIPSLFSFEAFRWWSC